MVAINRFGRFPKVSSSSSPGSKPILVVAALVTLFCCSFWNRSSIPEDITICSESIDNFRTPTKSVTIDVNKVCPSSANKINASNDHLPYPELMGLEEIYSVLKYWYEFNCVEVDADTGEKAAYSCNFHSIGQHLLHHAIERNETLLTVQVGAMDGISNDPMFEMYADAGYRSKHHVGVQSFKDLRNWLPVMIEPVPANYEALIETYTEKIAKTKSLACAVPINAAVSYDSSEKTCPFCRTNTAESAPKVCTDLPDWMKFQIGSLDCGYHKKYHKGDYSKKYHKDIFDLCIVQDPLPCTTITNLLAESFLSTKNIGIVQIDIEGYEYILLEGFMKELPDHLLPPIIHFEHKVMKHQDNEYPLEEGKKRLKIAEDVMKGKGYTLHNEGEDFLAIRVRGIRAFDNVMS